MQVLWFTQNRPDGISVGRRLIADHLRDDGWTVEQATATPMNAARYVFEAREYDVIVGTTHAGALIAWCLAELNRLPFVVDDIDPFEQFRSKVPIAVWWPIRKLENVALRRADHVLYVYQEERRRVDALAKSYSKTDFGVNYEHFASPVDDVVRTARETLEELPCGENTAVYVGGLNENYNIRAMISAFEELPEWRLIILGAGSLEDYVAEAAQRQRNVHFLGRVPHECVPGYLKASDVGLCLVDDARTLKTLEYMSAGLPVVHVDGAARERYDTLLNYCEPEPTSIAAAVTRAPSTTEIDRCRAVAEDHSWERIAADYKDAIQGVIT